MRDNLAGALSKGMRRDRWALDVAIGVMRALVNDEEDARAEAAE